MNTRNRLNHRTWLLALALLGPASGRAYTCTAEIPAITVSFSGTPVDVHTFLTVRCTRATNEPTLLNFRALAFLGLDPNPNVNPYRTVQLGGTADRIMYALRRFDGAGTCGNTTNWLAGNSDVIWADVLFFPSTRTQADDKHPICIRVLGPASTLSAVPVAGTYTDHFRVNVEFLGTGVPGPIDILVPVTVVAASYCRLRSPGALVFDYPSFSRLEVRGTTRAAVACSFRLPWTATIDPTQGTVAGVGYTLSMHRLTFTGTGYEQDANIIGVMPAGQAGTCGTGRCTGTRRHTLTIRY